MYIFVRVQEAAEGEGGEQDAHEQFQRYCDSMAASAVWGGQVGTPHGSTATLLLYGYASVRACTAAWSLQHVAPGWGGQHHAIPCLYLFLLFPFLLIPILSFFLCLPVQFSPFSFSFSRQNWARWRMCCAAASTSFLPACPLSPWARSMQVCVQPLEAPRKVDVHASAAAAPVTKPMQLSSGAACECISWPSMPLLCWHLWAPKEAPIPDHLLDLQTMERRCGSATSGMRTSWESITTASSQRSSCRMARGTSAATTSGDG